LFDIWTKTIGFHHIGLVTVWIGLWTPIIKKFVYRTYYYCIEPIL